MHFSRFFFFHQFATDPESTRCSQKEDIENAHSPHTVAFAGMFWVRGVCVRACVHVVRACACMCVLLFVVLCVCVCSYVYVVVMHTQHACLF